MLSSQRLWPRLWSSCVAFMYHLNSLALVRIPQVRPSLKVLALKPGQINQHPFWGGPANGRRDTRARMCLYGTGHGFTFQISVAYSAIVRSLENFPEPATLRIALRVHAPGSAYNAPSCSCAWQ